MAKYKDRCYAPEDLKKTQEVLLEILKETLRVCEENDIPITMYAGSAIGVVRHQGFIPWDDDIDLILMRKDYDRLLELLPEKLSDRFGVDDWVHNKDFPAPNACVYAKGTVAVPVEMKNIRYRYGISLGVYPYDNLWDDEKKAKKQIRKCWLFARLHWLKVLPFPYVPYHGFKKAVIHAICGFAHILLKPVPKKWFVEKCEKYARECENVETKRVTSLLDGVGTRMICDRDKLTPLVDGTFEGVPVKLYNNYKETLTKLYDFPYMELPPEEDRKNHFPCEMDFGDF